MRAKQLLSVLIAGVMLLSGVSAFAADGTELDRASLLKELHIMQGDPDGNLRLDDNVTRAEFTKVAVAASPQRNQVASGLAISPFRDVSHDFWGAAYIQAAVKNNICRGYPDGTFRPNDAVTLEEAVTMLVKVLGYTDDDFGISWPYGQVGLAENLDITKHVDRSIGDILNRRDVLNLVYNTLHAEQKTTKQKYITDFDCKILEDITLTATSKEDPSISGDKIVSTAGTFKISDESQKDYVGRRGDAVIKDGDKLICFTPDEQTATSYAVTSTIGSDLVLDGNVLDIDANLAVYYKSQRSTYRDIASKAKKGYLFTTYRNGDGDLEYALLSPNGTDSSSADYLEKYVVYSALDSNNIIIYQNGQRKDLDVDDTTESYLDSVRTTYGAIKMQLSVGDILYVKRDSKENIDYISVETNKLEGPVIVSGDSWASSLGVDVSKVSITRDGVRADTLKTNDVAYYSRELSMIFAYSDKVTGVYENALPNRDFPKTVTISGKQYEIEGTAAFDALSSSGAYRFGDTITVLLGKDRRIAGVMGAALAGDTMVTGYVYEAGQKEFTDSTDKQYNSFYIKLALPDGISAEYETQIDCKLYKHAVVNVKFENGKASVSRLKSPDSISGTFHFDSMTLGGEEVADDVNILDVASDDKDQSGSYVKVFPQRLDKVQIKASGVLYYDRNAEGQIQNLILKNVTGDAYQYGIVTKADTTNSAYVTMGSYTYDIDGKSSSVTLTNSAFSVRKGTVGRFAFDGGKLLSIQEIQSVGGISELTDRYLIARGQKYSLSDRVVAYEKNNGAYVKIKLEDLVVQSDLQKVTAYYDKSSESGGRVRILILEK